MRRIQRGFFPAAVLVASVLPAAADISGVVREQGSGTPVVGARVHVQADPTGPVAVTDAAGEFHLPVSPSDPVPLAASVLYDPAGANWVTGGTYASDGQTSVEILVPRLPVADDPGYATGLPQVADCGSCHVDQVDQWGAGSHALAADDPWVRDLFSGDGTAGGSAGYVFTDLHDPGETGFCATCHAPMADVFDPGNVMLDEVTSLAALDGVSCVSCHQMDRADPTATDALAHLGGVGYRFPEGGTVPTQEYVWGPLDDVIFGGMQALYAPLFTESLVCAGCHEYVNPGTGAPGQTTYSEWLDYAGSGPDARTCQGCHMPAEDEPGYLVEPIGGPPLRPGEQRHRHEMVGSTPDTLAAAVDLTTEVAEASGRIAVTSTVRNVGAGHAFPTGFSTRNAILVIDATWNGQPLPQIAGPTVPFWADDDEPGVQDGDLAGRAGTGFARVLEGRINGAGPTVRPVLFIDADGVWESSMLPAGASREVRVELRIPDGAAVGDVVEVRSRLLYRRAFRALAVSKGWDITPQGFPNEVEVARTEDEVVVTGAAGAVIPTAGPLGWLLLGVGIALVALMLLRRR